MADNPITRKEKYLAKLTGSYTGNVPDPITRVEKYLYDLCQKGISGLTPEEIENAVNKYLKENPVQPGATTEQAQQIEQNKKDVDSLKEDISTKITKFYASSQGETHLADSDNGKIMDMMLYGKSEQKQYNGCQLIDFSKGIYLKNATGSILNDTITVTAKKPYSGIQFPISLKKVMGNKIILTAKKSSQSNSKASISIRIVASTVNKKEYVDLSKAYNVSDNVTDIVAEIIVNNNATELDISNTVTVEGLQLQIGSEQLGWEPYTGGIPSPNPDYPQEIKSVVNPTVKVCGKNLYTYHNLISNFAGIKITRDGSNITLDGTANANGPEDVNTVLKNVFLKKGTYTLSYNIESGSKTLVGDNLFRISSNKPLATSIQVFITGTNNAVAFTLNEDVHASVICRINSGSVYNNCKFNIQIEAGSTPTAYEPYHEQTVTLPYTLNAIPVESGGNVTIDDQQYVSDYVDVERGKLVRMAGKLTISKAKVPGDAQWYDAEKSYSYEVGSWDIIPAAKKICISDHLTGYDFNDFYKKGIETGMLAGFEYIVVNISKRLNVCTTIDEFLTWFNESNVIGILETPTEIDLTTEEIKAFKLLQTYYPVSYISVASEQLDGYTIFNYPISMENGWNYVKQQIGDTRDYIYDMDARTQDTDLQAAEAYVNSEYAVALTELEV